jgi:hypothetical protein
MENAELTIVAEQSQDSLHSFAANTHKQAAPAAISSLLVAWCRPKRRLLDGFEEKS